MMRLGLVCTTFLLLWGCRPKEHTATTATSNSATSGGAAFELFYKRFHEDSAYQMQHILFPLKGLPNQADSADIADDNFVWQATDWVLHKPFDEKSDVYERSVAAVADGMIVEIIRFANGEYAMERRFAKFNEEWFLIYYAGMNRIAAPAPTQ